MSAGRDDSYHAKAQARVPQLHVAYSACHGVLREIVANSRTRRLLSLAEQARDRSARSLADFFEVSLG